MQMEIANYLPAYPKATFLVMSDLHYYDTALGTDGKAFNEYLANDRKLLKESEELLTTAVDAMQLIPAQFVLIPGDVTKDGEKQNHEKAAAFCARLEKQGKRVFVVPGNHDIDNPHAFRYTTNGKEPVPSVTADEFAAIYNEYGFSEAFSRDAFSLSYAVEPVPGLWLLGLDACLYRENQPDKEPAVNGRFQEETLVWLEKILMRSVREKKAVIAFMHHGVIEHFKGQNDYFGDYLVDYFPDIASLLAAFKVRLVFTGHFHAQDVAKMIRQKSAEDFLFDIQTGSLVTAPCPYRIVSILPQNRLRIESRFIDSIPSYPHGFRAYAEEYVAQGILETATKTLTQYWVPAEDVQKIAPQITAAFCAHYRGDESLPVGQEVLTEAGLSFMGGIVVGNRKELIYELWNDPPPPDNNLEIDLSTGDCK